MKLNTYKKLLIIPLACTLSGQAHPATFQYQEMTTSQTAGCINSTCNNVSTATIVANSKIVGINFSAIYLTPSGTLLNIEWLDGKIEWEPKNCTGAASNPNVSYHGQLLYSVDTRAVIGGNADFASGVITGHLEPVNKTGQSTRLDLTFPAEIDCDITDETVEIPFTSFLNVQKWWDGATPNYRITKQTGTITYRKMTSLSAAFNPSVISLTASVGKYIETSATLEISSTGITTVSINWPTTSGIQYDDERGEWVAQQPTNHKVTDGVTRVVQKIRVKGTQPGSAVYSIPIELTVQ